ncbi:hypothetical protein N5D09_03155 [Stutzerimonas stutzeri]|uniref:Uncharacterized protein n=1 Tax=Stutzerimonas stutzeri TaxID=316 RepID=A0ABD4XW55_STUST|nr:hypothetical protein [Stutzerimonas stutzeri]MDH0687085.1 hypothetical protein [Stutzerimonas stutzeri]
MSTMHPESVCFFAITGTDQVAKGAKEHFFHLDSGGCSAEVDCVDRGYIALRESLVDPEEVKFVAIGSLAELLGLHRQLSAEFPRDGVYEYPSGRRQSYLEEVLPHD